MNDLDKEKIVHQCIVQNMDDGLMTINNQGLIITFNPSAQKILEMKQEEVLGQPYMAVFSKYKENDAFNQTLLDAIYESSVIRRRVVDFYTGGATKTLSLTTSILKTNTGEKKNIGVIAVFDDITELKELRDSLQAMERIQKLNRDLQLRNRFISDLFGRYISEEVVKTLIEEPEALRLGGELKQVTIMMTDLRGFTSLSERLSADMVVSLLNNYLKIMVDIILEYKGTILEFIGDAILVIFGAPVAVTDHAEKAVACALTMQTSMPQANRWNIANGFQEVEMGIGINTGQVVVGNIGSPQRTKYGVVGKHVNLASRIESYTVGGQILISEETKSRVSAPLTILSKMEVKPKGVHEPITLYEVAAIGKPYNIHQREETVEVASLGRGVPFLVYMLDYKHVSEEVLHARCVKLSPKEAVLLCQADIPLYVDVKIQIKDMGFNALTDVIYGKVTAREKDASLVTVRFTYLTPEAKSLIGKLMKNG